VLSFLQLHEWSRVPLVNEKAYLLLNTQENEKRITQTPLRASIVHMIYMSNGLLEVGLF
jgi:hypothetical protein